jgi:hypothetical protein
MYCSHYPECAWVYEHGNQPILVGKLAIKAEAHLVYDHGERGRNPLAP